MDMSNTYTPPINNACVPDIYNKLDAEVIERTRIMNNQLNMRLLVEQKIIAKYKLEAERFRRKERSLVAKDLSRITKTLPAVINIRDFDEKFFNRTSRSDPLPRGKRRKKSYLEAKNEDPICQRCYIHHLPSKKRFYRKETPPPPPSIFESKLTNGHYDSKDKADLGSNSTAASTLHADQSESLSTTDRTDFDELETLQSDSPGKTSRLIPPADKFRFLERNSYGRDRDLNESLTPRLMPNEIWKNVVKNVCNQCLKEQKNASSTALKSRQPSRSHTREKTFERMRGNKSRRPSIANTNKPNVANSQPLPSIGPTNHTFQGNLNRRRTSVSVDDNIQAHQTKAPSRSTSKLSKNNGRSNSFRRPSLIISDAPFRSHSIVRQDEERSSKPVGNSEGEQTSCLENGESPSMPGKQPSDSHKMARSLENSRSNSSLMRQKT